MSHSPNRSGRSIVLSVYVAIVCFAAGVGYLLSSLGIATKAPRYLGLVPFEPTPVGLALYGALTMATVLGVPLVLVVLISRRND